MVNRKAKADDKTFHHIAPEQMLLADKTSPAFTLQFNEALGGVETSLEFRDKFEAFHVAVHFSTLGTDTW